MLKLKLQYSGPPMRRTDSLEKTLMLGTIAGRRKRGRQRMGTVGWHHRPDGHEFEQALGVGDGQGSLVCCSPWDHKQSDTTEWLNWTKENLNCIYRLHELALLNSMCMFSYKMLQKLTPCCFSAILWNLIFFVQISQVDHFKNQNFKCFFIKMILKPLRHMKDYSKNNIILTQSIPCDHHH